MEENHVNFMGAPIPRNLGSSPSAHMDYFQEYRNESISRMQVPSYEWGGLNISYAPHPDASVYKKTIEYARLPKSQFSMLDAARQQEVDDFYLACQLHRDQYKDYSGTLHPLDYFKSDEYSYQCPTDPTSQYIKCPEYFSKYKHPLTLPITLERSLRTPSLPNRALTGVYSPTSDIAYKR
ncbi:UPF0573 protein C2orf70 homolog B-like [Anoplophora glabripennis]|uniref:UPF0573 protein C2orf70 homolog B-like n=1 Tax=Anoplophora glabripennis TaxID=217634 RepID=UPI00087495F5|nr:UPF0573 protein C2orf70 homolog B-like [Anoplophora glabripennis]